MIRHTCPFCTRDLPPFPRKPSIPVAHVNLKGEPCAKPVDMGQTIVVSRAETKKVSCEKCFTTEQVRFVWPRFLCTGCYDQLRQPKVETPPSNDLGS